MQFIFSYFLVFHFREKTFILQYLISALKQITPVQFDGYMQSGGSTKPWKVFCISQPDDISGEFIELPYVVKVFTENHIRQGFSIAKEFICNLLAIEFDLIVPKAYLVDLQEENFKETLNKDCKQDLSLKHKGLTFASRLLDLTIYNEQITVPSLNIADCALLFAFDCLILNTDRGGYRNKPNLLVDDDSFVLIDHELALYILDNPNSLALNNIIELMKTGNWVSFYEKHIFYKKLKRYRNKAGLFDTFEESLRTLNIGKIKTLVAYLQYNGIDVGASEILFEYLRKLKKDAHQFSRILSSLIA